MTAKVIAVIISIALVIIIIAAVIMLHGSDASSAKATPTPASSAAAAAAASPSSSGLVTTDEVVGTGAEAVNGKTLSMSYTGTLADGTVFDSTSKDGGTPFSFTLGAGQVIKGWDEGIVGMKVGGTRKLVIPPALGYGSQGAGSTIPPNATLTFVVQLLGVK